MATRKAYYPAGSVTITISPENVASSSGLTAGVESNAIDNTSNLDLDHIVSGKWTSGTTPTVNTQVQVWVIPVVSDDLVGTVVYPDSGVFDGTSSAETATAAGVLQGAGFLARVINVDATTSNREYNAHFSVREVCGFMPSRYVLFVTHNTGVNSNTTAGNHVWKYLRYQETIA